MFIDANSHLYVYPISRDFGFAPNPFHGICTLATCKPDIRKGAKVGDWVMGIGGCALPSVRKKCIFLMKVSEKISFQNYWDDPRFSLKKPVRNGSLVQMLGDNIYHKCENGEWIQEDSHHSNPDGSPNNINLERDTGRCDQILISDFYFYFGSEAMGVDLDLIGYGRIRNFRKIKLSDSTEGQNMIRLITIKNRSFVNYIIADPCQFMHSHKRVDQGTGEIS